MTSRNYNVPDNFHADDVEFDEDGRAYIPVKDDTENLRRAMIESGQPEADLVFAEQRWTTDQLREEYDVIGFMAPFVIVQRKSDGAKGSMEFTHSPRFYFNFVADND